MKKKYIVLIGLFLIFGGVLLSIFNTSSPTLKIDNEIQSIELKISGESLQEYTISDENTIKEVVEIVNSMTTKDYYVGTYKDIEAPKSQSHILIFSGDNTIQYQLCGGYLTFVEDATLLDGKVFEVKDYSSVIHDIEQYFKSGTN